MVLVNNNMEILLKDIQINHITEFYNKEEDRKYLIDEDGLELTIQLPFTEVCGEVVYYNSRMEMKIEPPKGWKEFVENLSTNLYSDEYTKYKNSYESAIYYNWKFLKVNIYNNCVLFDALLQQQSINLLAKGDKVSLLVKTMISDICIHVFAEQIIVNKVLPIKRCEFNIFGDPELAQVLKMDSLKNICLAKLTDAEKELVKELII